MQNVIRKVDGKPCSSLLAYAMHSQKIASHDRNYYNALILATRKTLFSCLISHNTSRKKKFTGVMTECRQIVRIKAKLGLFICHLSLTITYLSEFHVSAACNFMDVMDKLTKATSSFENDPLTMKLNSVPNKEEE